MSFTHAAARRVLAASALAMFLVQAGHAGILTGLIAYYPLNGNANDASGNGYNLTLFGSPSFVAGRFGEALSLDGTSNSYASRTVSDAAFDFGTGDFSVRAWVDFASRVPTEQTLIEKFSNDSGPGWTLTTPGDDLQFYGGGQVDYGYTWGIDNWYQVLAVRSSGELSLYLNGSYLTSASLADDLASTFPLLLGRRNAGDGRNFGVNGLIDDVAIWNRALDEGEIGYLSSNPVMSSAVPEPASFSLIVVAGILLVVRKRLARG
jgi:hypothetical protein